MIVKVRVLVFPAAWGALKNLRLDINVLMAVAVTGAWLIGEGAEAATDLAFRLRCALAKE